MPTSLNLSPTRENSVESPTTAQNDTEEDVSEDEEISLPVAGATTAPMGKKDDKDSEFGVVNYLSDFYIEYLKSRGERIFKLMRELQSDKVLVRDAHAIGEELERDAVCLLGPRRELFFSTETLATGRMHRAPTRKRRMSVRRMSPVQ